MKKYNDLTIDCVVSDDNGEILQNLKLQWYLGRVVPPILISHLFIDRIESIDLNIDGLNNAIMYNKEDFIILLQQISEEANFVGVNTAPTSSSLILGEFKLMQKCGIYIDITIYIK